MSVNSTPPSQFERELRRKAFHMIVLVLPVVQLVLPKTSQTHTVLVAAGAVFGGLLLGMEILRLRDPGFFANRFARDSEQNQIAAYIPLFFVAYLIFLAFGLNVTVISIFISALGDAAAALFGIRFGKHHLPFTKKKSLEGTCAGFFVTLLIALIYVNLMLALALAVIMVLTDFVEDPKTTFLSDNFLNPFFFAVLLQLFPNLIH